MNKQGNKSGEGGYRCLNMSLSRIHGRRETNYGVFYVFVFGGDGLLQWCQYY